MSLENEIKTKSQLISTEAYSMSVGELVALYRDSELNIHPEFQRFFRWTPGQKTRFIESLLLGIPVPSIFVSQTELGTWDVVDGLQRISTVLELMGELKDQEGKLRPPLKLMATKYLPSLEGRVWKKAGTQDFELPLSAKLKIKRARFDLNIVLSKSDPKSKYELFDRLNTGGSIATDQEARNCIIIMVNRSFFDWMDSLRSDPNFQACLPLSERQLNEQYDMELVSRFLAFRSLNLEASPKIDELGSFLTEELIKMAEDESYNRKKEEAAFRRTFKILATTLDEDSFKKFDTAKSRPVGPVLISMYEIVALGIGYHILSSGYDKSAEQIRAIQQRVWEDPRFVDSSGSGVRASTRIPITLSLGRDLFQL